jgi:hypothetical protein
MRKGRAILRDSRGDETLRIEPYANGDRLECGSLSVKLTTAVARKLIAELQPYTEWLPPDIDRRKLPPRETIAQ